jgi:hypothetical protein
MQLQRVCHDTLPWLISFSLDAMSRITPTIIAIVSGWLFTALAQAHAAEPTLMQVESGDGLAHFTLTNPTHEPLFLLWSCTRTTRAPFTSGPSGEIDFPTRWRVEEADPREGLIVRVPPTASLHLVCSPPPGEHTWRVTAYVFRQATDKRAVYAPATEVMRAKRRDDHRRSRVYPEASNQSLEPTAEPGA